MASSVLAAGGRLIGLALLLACLAASAAEPRYVSLHANPVPLADDINPGDRVGRLRFLGMLVIPTTTVRGLRFSQISDLAWDDDDGVLYAISDKGALFHLRPVFDGEQLIDVQLHRAVALRDPHTDEPLQGRRADTEGLDVVRGRNGRRQDAELLVSFERSPRVGRYHPDGRALTELSVPAPLNEPRHYVDGNKMLEAMCVDDTLGILTAPEAPLRNEASGLTRIVSLSGRWWHYPVENANRVVGMACVGDGTVLVLERDYGRVLWRSLVALKRVQLTAGNAGAVLKPETIAVLNTSDGFQIDNFEGITRHRGNRFFLVSDNNDLFIQRTLLLYVELLDP